MRLGRYERVSRTAIAVLALSVLVPATVVPGPAQSREVKLDLKRHCKTKNLDYIGLHKPRNQKKWRHACGTHRFVGTTIRTVNVRYIDLGQVCRQHHRTDHWRAKGDKVWCNIPAAVTTLNLCNRGKEKVWAVISYWAGKGKGRRRLGPSGWVSVGWYGINPGACNDPKISRSYVGDVYIYGYSRNVSYDGSDARFCIKSGKAFRFGNADEMACGAGKLKKVGMHKFRVRKRTNTWNFR